MIYLAIAYVGMGVATLALFLFWDRARNILAEAAADGTPDEKYVVLVMMVFLWPVALGLLVLDVLAGRGK